VGSNMLFSPGGLSLAESWTVQVAAALVCVGSIRVYESRPRGSLARGGSLRVGRSQVPGGGRGVYVSEDLARGTVLGAYPGRLVPLKPYLQKLKVVPQTASYCWTLGDRGALDPTDAAGVLCEPLPFFEVLPTFGLLSVDTTLALINEPCAGFDVNVKTEEQGVDVVFYTERDIAAGEELFLDYGMKYDRSGYSMGGS